MEELTKAELIAIIEKLSARVAELEAERNIRNVKVKQKVSGFRSVRRREI